MKKQNQDEKDNVQQELKDNVPQKLNIEKQDKYEKVNALRQQESQDSNSLQFQDVVDQMMYASINTQESPQKKLKRVIRTKINLSTENKTQEQLLQVSKTIMNQKIRTKQELEYLQNCFKNIKFFRELAESEDPTMVLQCLKQMNLEEYEPHETIIQQGNKGDKFYVVLEGKCAVFIKSSSYDQNKQIERETRQQKIEKKRNELEKLGLKFEESKYFKETRIPHPIMKGVEQDEVVQVGTIVSGIGFGELALMNDAPRLASIVSLEYCCLAVLNKKDFKEIVQKEKEKKLKQQLDFLKSILGFEKLSRRSLNVFIFAFKQLDYSFREKIYSEGDQSQRFFVILEGEFIMSKRVYYERDKEESVYELEEFNQKFLPKCKKNFRTLDIATLGKGQLLGEYEVFSKEAKKYTLTCCSKSGSVWYVDYQDFLKKIELVNEGDFLRNLQLVAKQKDQWIQKEIKQKCLTTQNFKSLLLPLDTRQSQSKLDFKNLGQEENLHQVGNSLESATNSSKILKNLKKNMAAASNQQSMKKLENSQIREDKGEMEEEENNENDQNQNNTTFLTNLEENKKKSLKNLPIQSERNSKNQSEVQTQRNNQEKQFILRKRQQSVDYKNKKPFIQNDFATDKIIIEDQVNEKLQNKFFYLNQTCNLQQNLNFNKNKTNNLNEDSLPRTEAQSRQQAQRSCTANSQINKRPNSQLTTARIGAPGNQTNNQFFIHNKKSSIDNKLIQERIECILRDPEQFNNVNNSTNHNNYFSKNENDKRTLSFSIQQQPEISQNAEYIVQYNNENFYNMMGDINNSGTKRIQKRQVQGEQKDINQSKIREIFGQNSLLKRILNDRKNKNKSRKGTSVHYNPRSFVSFVNLM